MSNSNCSNVITESVRQMLAANAGKSGSGVVGIGFWIWVSDSSLTSGQLITALTELENANIITVFPQGEGERPMIVVRPARVRCPDCRQWHSGYGDWNDHLDECLRQRERLRRRGMLYSWKLAEPRRKDV